jgi:NADH-quinone oxidoreductase subunit N
MSPIPMPALAAVDWWALGPLMVLSVGFMLLLLLEFLPTSAPNGRAAIVSLATLAAAGYALFRVGDAKRELFGGMFLQDGFTVFFTLLFIGIAALSVLQSWDYLKRTGLRESEFYALTLAATIGMILMAASGDLITIFLGLELMSLALYVLVGFRRWQLESSEAALKYFLMGAFASGFLLYGIALLYGATGTTQLARMAAFLGDTPDPGNPLLIAGGLLVLVGFAFKVAAVPFHMWTPDAYEGAPTTVTGYMSVGAKAAAFAALLRLLLVGLPDIGREWAPVLSWIAVLTMTVGNVTALLQNNVKRMLAYSSIAHAGYVLVAVIAGGRDGGSAALFYLAVYSAMNLGAFGVLAMLGRGGEERVQIADLAGVGFRSPFLALAMTVFMLSLGGIPPTAGFMGKVYVFGTALQANLLPLVIVGVLNSVVSVFYYLRVTVAMYMSEPRGEPTGVSWGAPSLIALIVTLALTLWWGVQAQGLLDQARQSVFSLL